MAEMRNIAASVVLLVAISSAAAAEPPLVLGQPRATPSPHSPTAGIVDGARPQGSSRATMHAPHSGHRVVAHPHRGGHHRHHPHGGHGGGVIYYPYSVPYYAPAYPPAYYGAPYAISPYGAYPYGAYAYGPYRYGAYGVPYVLPPLTLPAETLFGPQAVKRFLGVSGGNAAPQVAAAAVAEPDLVLRRAAAAAPAARLANGARQANGAALERAWKFVDFGDARFRRGEIHQALERYKQAARAAPSLGEAFLRQGHALLALGLYERAVEEYRQGLTLDPNWPRSGFRFDDFYGPGNDEAAEHFEKLLAAARERPHDGKLYFLLGLRFYFDGQRERAGKFFRRAGELGVAAELVEPLLDAVEEAALAKPAP